MISSIPNIACAEQSLASSGPESGTSFLAADTQFNYL